jgi:ABC-type sugar transport system substrate-binding protein
MKNGKMIFLVILAAACMAAIPLKGLGASGRPDSAGSNLIAVSLPSLDNPLMLNIGESMRAAFRDKNVEVASANSDPNTQAAQIQNYITMNAEMIVVMPVEASSLVSILKDARSRGIKVVVNGVSMEAGSYDAMASVNQYLVGQYCAVMAKEWIDAQYPNAAPGTVEALILTSSLNEDALARTRGLLSVTETYRKNLEGEYVDENNRVVAGADRVLNPVFIPQLRVVETTDAEMFQAAQVAVENALTKNPNIRLIMTYASDGAAGAGQVIMDRGYSPEELGKIAVFGCGLIGPEEANLKEASTGGGVFRGAVAFGGADLPGEMAALARRVYLDEPYEADTWDPIAKVYAVNGEINRVLVNNTGAVQVK